MKIYFNLYISECWKEKKGKLIKRLRKNRLLPNMYVIALTASDRNNLEFYSGVLLRQHIFQNSSLFIVGIADGYNGCLSLTEKIVSDVYNETGGADIRAYILETQMKYEKAGQ